MEQIPELWHNSLTDRLPHQDLPAKNDPLYPVDVEQIIAQHQRYYKQRYEQPVIVRGVNVSDANIQE